jgi:hypothetical protein
MTTGVLTISITPALAKLIARELHSGRYQTAREVVGATSIG